MQTKRIEIAVKSGLFTAKVMVFKCNKQINVHCISHSTFIHAYFGRGEILNTLIWAQMIWIVWIAKRVERFTIFSPRKLASADLVINGIFSVLWNEESKLCVYFTPNIFARCTVNIDHAFAECSIHYNNESWLMTNIFETFKQTGLLVTISSNQIGKLLKIVVAQTKSKSIFKTHLATHMSAKCRMGLVCLYVYVRCTLNTLFFVWSFHLMNDFSGFIGKRWLWYSFILMEWNEIWVKFTLALHSK